MLRGDQLPGEVFWTVSGALISCVEHLAPEEIFNGLVHAICTLHSVVLVLALVVTQFSIAGVIGHLRRGSEQ